MSAADSDWRYEGKVASSLGRCVWRGVMLIWEGSSSSSGSTRSAVAVASARAGARAGAELSDCLLVWQGWKGKALLLPAQNYRLQARLRGANGESRRDEKREARS